MSHRRRDDPAARAREEGWRIAASHPMFRPIANRLSYPQPRQGSPGPWWAVVNVQTEELVVHPERRADPAEWAWVFAHVMTHLGFGHDNLDTLDAAARAAAEVIVCRFQHAAKVGRAPAEIPVVLPTGSEDVLTEQWRVGGVPPEFAGLGVGGRASCVEGEPPPAKPWLTPWEELFALGLSESVAAAIDVAGGARESIRSQAPRQRPWDLARSWFIASYPLLASTMAAMTVVADAELCRGWDIAVAAVDPVAGEIYINPLTTLSSEEWRFVLAHEALHAALAHHARTGGRDRYLFNLACDFVINGWLVEMGVGVLPEGLLLDQQFDGMSAEEVYDVIVRRERQYRRLATARGRPSPDILPGQGRSPGTAGTARPPGVTSVDLDEALRRGLLTGLDLHVDGGRGLLPAGLVQEIRALAHPAPRWDVALAHWFDELFPAIDPVQSYARPSRRQSATPDIPRPGWYLPTEPVSRRTFGVVLDTSGSMSAELMGKALGAIGEYSRTHDVPAARVVFCDALAYDAGYLAPDEIADRVRVRGRGGTVLQPGVDLLVRADDFPVDGPILVITDGGCDVLRITREHAFLIPAAASLPFRAKGPVFRFE